MNKKWKLFLHLNNKHGNAELDTDRMQLEFGRVTNLPTYTQLQ